MLTLHGHSLQYAFPEVNKKARCRVVFERALRVPDDQGSYLWPNLPVHPVDDHLDPLPDDGGRHGGVFLPMNQAEAVAHYFSEPYLCAVKVGAGQINAVTGEPWQSELVPGHQVVLVSSQNCFLEGFKIGADRVRQFEEQLTGLGA